MPDLNQQNLTAEQLVAVRGVLSEARFGTYLAAAGHDCDRAWRLHLWNARLGEAFHLPIQTVEVCLRNRLDGVFTNEFGQDWGTKRAFKDLLDEKTLSDLTVVMTRIENRRLPRVNGQIVAGLSFGFWIALLGPRFNPRIWSSNLRTAFPHLPAHLDRDKVAQRFRKIAQLRNRISHHEPLLRRNHSQDYSHIMEAISWMCKHTGKLIKPECRVTTVMRERP